MRSNWFIEAKGGPVGEFFNLFAEIHHVHIHVASSTYTSFKPFFKQINQIKSIATGQEIRCKFIQSIEYSTAGNLICKQRSSFWMGANFDNNLNILFSSNSRTLRENDSEFTIRIICTWLAYVFLASLALRSTFDLIIHKPITIVRQEEVPPGPPLCQSRWLNG